ncbi:Ig-like domain-containing protein [Sunxiuqinia elliptica]|uniref:Ig-like protein group 2 n=1 Tax=Sunxiuqinia elliptica TaxID=655355 RepID=A0A4R6GT91_9BACT|nr:Ig-like domain-containing protein [Sunxiuqinia elliptica]TDN98407.1 Ig-like protein group 2 [Sunxiuqinia elliptica]TDO60510.1 Ig-like protein group 2 [Sunxiuqinia elliptica]
MKLNYWIICIVTLLSASVVSCDSDNDELSDVIKVTRIEVEGAIDNLIELEVADEHTLNVKLTPDEAVDKDEYTYTYLSSNEDIFKVNEQGVITALGEGEAALRVDAVNNTDLWAVVTIKVKSKLFLVESLNVPEKFKDLYIGVGKSINLPDLISITPEYATNKDLVYSSSNASVAKVSRKGVLSTLSLGNATITINADDGSSVETTIELHVRNSTYQNLDRTDWTVATSHQYFADATVVGSPESLIDEPTAYGTDENEPTCLCMVKPGKSLGDISVGANEEVHFIIDMKSEQEFNGFKLRHRLKNGSAFLRLIEASVYGSNNGADFLPVAEGLSINVEEDEVLVDWPTTATYRYLKLTYDKWHSSGSTVQISDFNLLKLVYED